LFCNSPWTKGSVTSTQFKDIYSRLEYVEKGLQYVPPLKEKEKEPGPVALVLKVEQRLVMIAEDDDDDEPAAAPVKVHNPLDDLPKATLRTGGGRTPT